MKNSDIKQSMYNWLIAIVLAIVVAGVTLCICLMPKHLLIASAYVDTLVTDVTYSFVARSNVGTLDDEQSSFTGTILINNVSYNIYSISTMEPGNVTFNLSNSTFLSIFYDDTLSSIVLSDLNNSVSLTDPVIYITLATIDYGSYEVYNYLQNSLTVSAPPVPSDPVPDVEPSSTFTLSTNTWYPLKNTFQGHFWHDAYQYQDVGLRIDVIGTDDNGDDISYDLDTGTWYFYDDTNTADSLYYYFQCTNTLHDINNVEYTYIYRLKLYVDQLTETASWKIWIKIGDVVDVDDVPISDYKAAIRIRNFGNQSKSEMWENVSAYLYTSLPQPSINTDVSYTTNTVFDYDIVDDTNSVSNVSLTSYALYTDTPMTNTSRVLIHYNLGQNRWRVFYQNFDSNTLNSIKFLCLAIPDDVIEAYVYYDGYPSDPLILSSTSNATLFNAYRNNYESLQVIDRHDSGYSAGYSAGYNVGYDIGSTENNNLVNLVWNVFEFPPRILFGTYDNDSNSDTYGQWVGGLFNFSILGLDVRAFVLAIMSCVIVVAIIRFILGMRGN